MAVEVEAKFRTAGTAPLDDLSRRERLGPAHLEPARTVEEVDRYLDTPAGDLGAARWACRLRLRNGVTTASLKGPLEPESQGWFHRRPEVEGPATPSDDPAAWPPSPARDLVERLGGGRPMVERFTLRQRRTERGVIVGGRRIGTLSLDVVAVERDGRPAGQLHVVELELGDAADAALLGSLGRELSALPGLEPEPASKLERALALLGES